MHSPHRRSTLLAAARGASQRAVAFHNATARNLMNAAGDLTPEDALRFNAALKRSERLARESADLAAEIASFTPAPAREDAA